MPSRRFEQTSLKRHITTRYRQGYSTPDACAASKSPVLAMLSKGHGKAKLNAQEMARLQAWMDVYAQRSGSFSSDQEERLVELRVRMAKLLKE